MFAYRCPQGHETDELRHHDVVSIPCLCGAEALRQAVNQFAVIGQASVPRDERNYRKSYSEYREALADVVYDNEKVQKNGQRVIEPDYYDAARAQAKAKGANIR